MIGAERAARVRKRECFQLSQRQRRWQLGSRAAPGPVSLLNSLRIAALDGQNNQKFPWDQDVVKALYEVFGIQSFRHNQKAIINCVKSGYDVFAVMPTGGGKSLTFQLPTIISNKVTIVIQPLISLIYDQVSQMQTIGINAYTFKSETAEQYN